MSTDRTSVFEMRDLAGPAVRDEMLTPAQVDAHPVRDIDKLADALARHDSVSAVAAALDCTRDEVHQWADIYGLEYELLSVGVVRDV